MHKITEDRFKDWFPKDNRFLHFCAKFYGFSFHSEEVVEEASFEACRNIMRLMKRGQEFETEEKLMGTVMWCFRYGILSAYDTMKRRSRLDIRNDSELTYSGRHRSEGDDISLYERACVYHDKPYSNVMELIDDAMMNELTWDERNIVKMYFIDDIKPADIKKKLDLNNRQFNNGYNRALAKLKIKVKENESKPIIKRNTKSPVLSVRKDNRVEPVVKNKEKDSYYTKAMSFLYNA